MNDDETILYSSCLNGDISIWNMIEETLKFQFKAHITLLTDIIVDDVNERLITASKDKLINIWSIGDYELLDSIPYPKAPLNKIIYLKKEKTIVSCSDDKNVKIYQL